MPNVNVLSVVKYAPVVLIVLGIEVLIYAARPDVKIKYDVISIFLCIIIMLTAGASGAVAAVAQAFTPENVTKRVTTEEQYKKSVQKALSNIPNAHDLYMIIPLMSAARAGSWICRWVRCTQRCT